MEHLIAKYLQGDLTLSERHELSKWLQNDEKNAETLKRIYAYWHYHKDGLETEELAVRIRLHNMMQQELGNARESRKTVWNMRYGIAASVIIFCSLVFGFYQYKSASEAESRRLQTRLIEKVSLPGQKITTQLPDGTKVRLNADSKLIVPASFEGETREVTLIGEAFFDVARDESKPFLIHTGNIVTKVLGTSFNVRAYHNDENIQVVVKSGKVSVEKANNAGKGEKAILLPMELVTYHQSGKLVKEKVDNPAHYLSWKENIIYLHDARWLEIETTLERWYGKKINVSGEPALGKGYTGTFKDLSLEGVLDRMSYSLNFEYEFDKNNDIFILFKN